MDKIVLLMVIVFVLFMALIVFRVDLLFFVGLIAIIAWVFFLSPGAPFKEWGFGREEPPRLDPEDNWRG